MVSNFENGVPADHSLATGHLLFFCFDLITTAKAGQLEVNV